jgi:hypothetical protein
MKGRDYLEKLGLDGRKVTLSWILYIEFTHEGEMNLVRAGFTDGS